MSKKQMNRLTKMELQVQRPHITRTILAAFADYDEELEGHDSIRAKLHIRPEVGVEDLVCYRLSKGSPPCLKVPRVWQHAIYPPAEETVVECEGEPATQLALSASAPETPVPR